MIHILNWLWTNWIFFRVIHFNLSSRCLWLFDEHGERCLSANYSNCPSVCSAKAWHPFATVNIDSNHLKLCQNIRLSGKGKISNSPAIDSPLRNIRLIRNRRSCLFVNIHVFIDYRIVKFLVVSFKIDSVVMSFYSPRRICLLNISIQGTFSMITWVTETCAVCMLSKATWGTKSQIFTDVVSRRSNSLKYEPITDCCIPLTTGLQCLTSFHIMSCSR